MYLSAPSGKEVWSEISYGRVTDTNGRLAGVVHIVRDLTQRKEIERLKDEFIDETEYVWVYIRRLRCKIEPDPGNPLHPDPARRRILFRRTTVEQETTLPDIVWQASRRF